MASYAPISLLAASVLNLEPSLIAFYFPHFSVENLHSIGCKFEVMSCPQCNGVVFTMQQSLCTSRRFISTSVHTRSLCVHDLQVKCLHKRPIHYSHIMCVLRGGGRFHVWVSFGTSALCPNRLNILITVEALSGVPYPGRRGALGEGGTGPAGRPSVVLHREEAHFQFVDSGMYVCLPVCLCARTCIGHVSI